MKTMKQIADELGIPKQQVYRYIKKHRISETTQENGTLMYDRTAEMLIKRGFEYVSESAEPNHHASNEAVLIGMLQKELDAKNRQIDDLTTALVLSQETAKAAQESAKAAQALHAGTIQRDLIGAGDDEQNEEPPGFWRRLFGKK